MTDTSTPPRGYHAVNVREFTNAHGKTVRAHTRFMPNKRKLVQPKPLAKTTVAPYPRHTHARHLHEQLAVPLAFFSGLSRGMEFRAPEPDHDRMLRQCIAAIRDAQQFIDRFTKPEWVPDEQQIKATAEFDAKYPWPKS